MCSRKCLCSPRGRVLVYLAGAARSHLSVACYHHHISRLLRTAFSLEAADKLVVSVFFAKSGTYNGRYASLSAVRRQNVVNGGRSASRTRRTRQGLRLIGRCRGGRKAPPRGGRPRWKASVCVFGLRDGNRVVAEGAYSTIYGRGAQRSSAKDHRKAIMSARFIGGVVKKGLAIYLADFLVVPGSLRVSTFSSTFWKSAAKVDDLDTA